MTIVKDADGEDYVRLNFRGEVTAILSLNHPRLAECLAEDLPTITVFVWPDCAECCGWRPTKLCNLRTEVNPGCYHYGDMGFDLNGKLVIRMANDFTCGTES